MDLSVCLNVWQYKKIVSLQLLKWPGSLQLEFDILITRDFGGLTLICMPGLVPTGLLHVGYKKVGCYQLFSQLLVQHITHMQLDMFISPLHYLYAPQEQPTEEHADQDDVITPDAAELDEENARRLQEKGTYLVSVL